MQAHRLFGRHLMGCPIEQQKYQSLGNLVLTFPGSGEHTAYRHELDLDTAVATTTYERDGLRYRREVFSSPVDQVIVVRVTAEPAGRLKVEDDRLVIRDASAVTLLIAAATSFVNDKDVSGDPESRADTALAAGSAIDTQITADLFTVVSDAAGVLGVDAELRDRIATAKARLAPMRIGKNGDLQEWLEDWGQREKSHRHISNLYGLFPGNQISLRRTPELAAASHAVLNQRGLPGNGWASAWKAAAWARLFDGARALENIVYAVKNYTTDCLFSTCSRAMQVD